MQEVLEPAAGINLVRFRVVDAETDALICEVEMRDMVDADTDPIDVKRFLRQQIEIALARKAEETIRQERWEAGREKLAGLLDSEFVLDISKPSVPEMEVKRRKGRYVLTGTASEPGILIIDLIEGELAPDQPPLIREAISGEFSVVLPKGVKKVKVSFENELAVMSDSIEFVLSSESKKK